MLSAETWWEFPLNLRLKDLGEYKPLGQEVDDENMVSGPWDLEEGTWIKFAVSLCVRYRRGDWKSRLIRLRHRIGRENLYIYQ